MKKILYTIPLLFLVGCGVDVQKGTKAAEATGLTDVKVGSWTFFGCDEKDSFRSTFTATGVDGKPVSGVMCSGWFKGITIRFD